jgi:hypothetical protein
VPRMAIVQISEITPLERSILLNPADPEIKQLRVEAGRPFHFDPRIVRCPIGRFAPRLWETETGEHRGL